MYHKKIPLFNMNCITAFYYQLPDDIIGVINTIEKVNDFKFVRNTTSKASIEGKARFQDHSKNEGRLQIKWNLLHLFHLLSGLDIFDVMSTDYTSYLIVYKCRTHFFSRKKSENVLVLTR